MDLSLHACQRCPIVISNRVENRNWLLLVSLTRWRTNSKILSVSNRPVSWCPMSQGAPVSPTHQMKGFYHICFIRLTSMYVFIKFICFSILVLCIVHFLVTLSQSEARACTIANTESRTNKSPNTTRTVACTTLLALQYLKHISTLK